MSVSDWLCEWQIICHPSIIHCFVNLRKKCVWQVILEKETIVVYNINNFGAP